MGSGKTVLFVENDVRLLENSRILGRYGYSALTASSLQEARNMLSNISDSSQGSRPDIIVLDIMLPDGSGIDFCREIRASLWIPILFLSALNDKDYVISCLRAGGDDCLSIPFDFDVLEARIEALLRRSCFARQAASDEFEMGGVKLDSLSGRAYVEDSDAGLTHMEFSLLKLLIKNSGRLITNDNIFKSVWGADAMLDYHTLRQHIYSIRKKLWEIGTPKFEIESSRGIGYRLIVQNSA
jgi:DNA-binding response OmpR family regulator